jgi:hypothetical protein
MIQLWHKLLCFLIDHVDAVVTIKPHVSTCKCRGGGSHGDVHYKCARCGREETHSELVC